VSPPSESPAERAEFVLDELLATLEFLLDDGVTDADDSRLERLAAEHSQPASKDAFAAALDDYAGFAETVRERIHGLGGFDAGLIDEARALAVSLREQSARRVTQAPPEAQRQALELRNRLMGMLYERLQLVRAAVLSVLGRAVFMPRGLLADRDKRPDVGVRHGRGSGRDGSRVGDRAGL
jgi:hypothetical protein